MSPPFARSAGNHSLGVIQRRASVVPDVGNGHTVEPGYRKSVSSKMPKRLASAMLDQLEVHATQVWGYVRLTRHLRLRGNNRNPFRVVWREASLHSYWQISIGRGMWRIAFQNGRLSDMLNITRAKGSHEARATIQPACLSLILFSWNKEWNISQPRASAIFILRAFSYPHRKRLLMWVGRQAFNQGKSGRSLQVVTTPPMPALSRRRLPGPTRIRRELFAGCGPMAVPRR